MDTHAKAFLKQPPKQFVPHRLTPFFPTQKLCLKIHGTSLVSNMDNHIHLHKHGPGMETRPIQKQILSKQNINKIQWRGIERAMRRYKSASKIKRVKFFHNKLPTAKLISGWYSSMSTTCLRCKSAEETFDHVIQCRSQQAKLSFEKALKEVRSALRKIKTEPIVMTTLIPSLEEYRRGFPPPLQSHPFTSQKIQQAAKRVAAKQKSIRISLLARGLLVTEWEALQNISSNHSTTAESNLEWSSQVINTMWWFSLSLWDARCEKINAPGQGNRPSIKKQDLLRVLQEELDSIKATQDYDTHQLILNIEERKRRAHETTINKWLNMIRHRKEEESRRQSHDKSYAPTAQSIQRFFPRRFGADA